MRAYHVAWGDVEGDGDLDLAVAAEYGSGGRDLNVLLFKNSVNGLPFTPSQRVTGPARTAFLAWGNIDSDGALDLAVAQGRGSDALVYRSQSGQLLDTVLPPDRQEERQAVAWGDADGDGRMDLVVGSSFADPRVYWNRNGTLTAAADALTTDRPIINALKWIDIDLDGDLDLSTGEPNGTRMFRNCRVPNDVAACQRTASGFYEDSGLAPVDRLVNVTSLAWGDIDGDSCPDLVLGAGNGVFAFKNGEPGACGSGLRPFPRPWHEGPEQVQGYSVDLGDVDGDGDLDLATGAPEQAPRVFRNERGAFQDTSSWLSTDVDQSVLALAWADVDGDADLDLSVAGPNGVRIYSNQSSPLSGCRVTEVEPTTDAPGLDLGDIDGDGTMELAAGYLCREATESLGCKPRLRVYAGPDDAGSWSTVWSEPDGGAWTDLAWGDVDDSPGQELAVAGMCKAAVASGLVSDEHATDSTRQCEPSGLYTFRWNDQRRTYDAAFWRSTYREPTTSLLLADVDGDGRLDLVVGSNCLDPLASDACQAVVVHYNRGGTLDPTASAILDERAWGTDLAAADVDGDGDTDLAVTLGQVGIRVLIQVAGAFQPAQGWSRDTRTWASSPAFGDVDGDGDPDLAIAMHPGKVELHENRSGTLAPEAEWISNDVDTNHAVAWSDADGDGDLDLAASSEKSVRLYRNEGGRLSVDPVWTATGTGDVYSMAWADVNHDGSPDLATSAWGGPIQVFLGASPTHPPFDRHPLGVGFSAWESGRPLPVSGAAFHYRLFDPTGQDFDAVRMDVSLDGDGGWSLTPASGRWLPARPGPGNTVSNRDASFLWSPRASGLSGRSDFAAARLAAIPGRGVVPNGVPGPFQRPLVAAQSHAFRLNGVQVKVLQDGQGQAGAMVYKLPAGKSTGALPFASFDGEPFRTDDLGRLPGRGQIQAGDRLVALSPAALNGSFTVYVTSAAPDETGLAVQAVGDSPDDQSLSVSKNNALILFPLRVSLEWDARSDPLYRDQLAADIKRASEQLYDWTDGQAALGQVTVFDNRRNWTDSDVVVYASNRVRPSAVQGGIVPLGARRIDPDAPTISYSSGQVHIGAIWNRFGDSSGSLAEDWSRTLAHELGHYLFFLDDLYLGFDQDGFLKETDSCIGSSMGDPYLYSEFHHGVWDGHDWAQDCGETLAQVFTGRWDWKTIETFYRQENGSQAPWINGAHPLQGPASLPLAVTAVRFATPEPEHLARSAPLAAPYFNVNAPGGKVSSFARGFLFHGKPYTEAPGTQSVADLGRPVSSRILARGAGTGDTVCVFDLSRERLVIDGDATDGDAAVRIRKPAVGCRTIADQDTQEIDLLPVDAWAPDVSLSAEIGAIADSGDDHLGVTVAGGASKLPDQAALYARLYPRDGPATKAIQLRGDAANGYSGRFVLANFNVGTLRFPPEGLVHIWVESVDGVSEPAAGRRETMADYAIGGNPGRMWGSGGRMWGSGGRMWGSGAPVLSPDGKVVLHSRQQDFQEGQFISLQQVSTLPNLPAWLTPVGEGYKVSAEGISFARASGTPGATLAARYALREAAEPLAVSIAFNYLGGDVTPGEEHQGWLLVGRYDETRQTWDMRSDTRLDPDHNVASARVEQGGIYALFSNVPVTMQGPGWVPLLFPVPVTAPRPVPSALASIAGRYNTVYGYQAEDAEDPWKVYAPSAPDWVNDLAGLEFDHPYWIYLTTAEALTVRYRGTGPLVIGVRKGKEAPRPNQAPSLLGLPPATYYGMVGPEVGALGDPATGGVIEAFVGDRLCGHAPVRRKDGVPRYAVNVLAESSVEPASNGCGRPGREVRFSLKICTAGPANACGSPLPLAPRATWDDTAVHPLDVDLDPSLTTPSPIPTPTVMPVGTVTAAPGPLDFKVSCSAMEGDPTRITVEWTDATTYETDFLIQAAVDGGPWLRLDAVVPSFTTAGRGGLYRYHSPVLPAGTIVRFRVQARNSTTGEVSIPSVPTEGCRTANASGAESGCIHGRIDLQGRPAGSGTWIRLNGFPVLQSANDGGFDRCGILPGAYRIGAWAPGYLTAATESRQIGVGEQVQLGAAELFGGDVNVDGMINLFDLVRVGAAYKIEPPRDLAADINADGQVNLYDLVLIGANYGLTAPTHWAAAARTGLGTGRLASGRRQASDMGGRLELVSRREGPGVALDIKLRQASGIYGADLTLSVDPSKVGVLDASPDTPGTQIEPGAIWATGGSFVVANTVADSKGRSQVHFAASLLQPSAPLQGDVILATIHLRPLDPDLFNAMTMESVSLSDSQGHPVSAVWSGGGIRFAYTARVFLPSLQRAAGDG